MTSYIMEHHQRSPIGNSKIITYMTDYYRLPKDFESLVYLTQVLQAEAIRFGVEHWRRNRHRTSGTLYWQLNDCWPVASWASLDYYGRWKALHYAARRFHAPLLLSIEDDQTKMGVHVTSDLTEPWGGAVRWSLETLEGDVLDSGQEEVLAPPLSTTRIRTLNFTESITDDNRRDMVFICELWHDSQRVTLDVTAFVPDKHLALASPELAVGVRLEADQLACAVTAQSLARFVELSLAGANVVFSDNFFDLPAGRTVTVTCPLPDGWTVEAARQALKVRSLYDSFA
jgi:beta-mannosidase